MAFPDERYFVDERGGERHQKLWQMVEPEYGEA